MKYPEGVPVDLAVKAALLPGKAGLIYMMFWKDHVQKCGVKDHIPSTSNPARARWQHSHNSTRPPSTTPIIWPYPDTSADG